MELLAAPKQPERLDVGEQQSVKARNEIVRDQETLRREALKQIMSTPQGRDWMFWLLSICKIGHTVFDTNALKMAFAAGEQNIGIQLHGLITTPELLGSYNQMLREREPKDERKK